MLKAVLLLASAFAAVSTADYSKTYSGLPSGQQEKLSGAKFYMDHLPSLIPFRCYGQDHGCCSPGDPCGLSDGECRSDPDCAPGLECTDECMMSEGEKCCNYRDLCVGASGCCRPERPCLGGEGPCKSDSDCAGNYKCGTGNCFSGEGAAFQDGDGCCE